MTTNYPSLRMVTRAGVFYAAIFARILIIRPAMILGVFAVALFIWLSFHPQDWKTYVREEAKSYQEAPLGSVMEVQCDFEDNSKLLTKEGCNTAAVELDEYAESGLRAMTRWAKILILVSAFMEIFQVVTGRRKLLPDSVAGR